MEILYYAWSNVRYALVDMSQCLLIMVCCMILCHITLKTEKSKRTVFLTWGALILGAYGVVVVISSFQYAVYYDMFADLIANNTFLYVLLWMVDALLLLFVVFVCGYGADRLYQDRKEKKVFCVVLFSLFIGFVTSFGGEAVYLLFYHKVNGEGYYEKNVPLYLLVQASCLLLLLILYHKKMKSVLMEVLNAPGLPLQKFVRSPLLSIFLYYLLIKTIKSAGISIFQKNMTLISCMIFSAIILIFIIVYKDLLYSMKISGTLAKTEAEIGVAQVIQKSILPNTFPAFPERKDFDVHASMEPCLGVGGDFYDYFLLPDERQLVVVMADVSGKGIPAALFMMRSRTLIKSFFLSNPDMKSMIDRVNSMLCMGNDANMFVTAFVGILDTQTGEFRFVNAGHNFPLISYDGIHFEYLKTKVNMVMGAIEGISYQQFEIMLPKGAMLYLYTDGVTEALNEDKEFYGEERLLQLLNEMNKREFTLEGIINYIGSDLKKFAQTEPQADDITMLILQYYGNEEKGQWKEITVYAEIEQYEKVNDFVEAQLVQAGCNNEEMMQILIAVEEIFVNIASYAYEGREGEVHIMVETAREDTCCKTVITFEDSGIAYNPLERREPDITLSAQEREPGGLGILMVKKIMDNVGYEYCQGKNCLTLVKRFSMQ